MKEACSRNDSSPLLHRVHGTVAVKAASILDDPSAKARYLRAAVESARRAAALSPSSVEFSHFYASLLYESAAAAGDGRGYEDVVQECERALAIPNPVDPARESLQDSPDGRLPTAEARVASVHQDIHALVQKANIASISTWMKTLGGNGEEKFRLIPMRRPAEDPMEVRLVPAARRPNEIKKANKTPEERRKEIEVRVAAARLLQQKTDGSVSQNDDGADSPSPSSSSSTRLADRRKLSSSRKVTSSTDRKDQVRKYWNLMTANQKLAFLVVNIHDLRAHYAPSAKYSLASNILSEALSFVEANGTWKFWCCCRCKERFTDADSHMQHVIREHMSSLSLKLQSVLPQEVDGEWIEMLVNGSWKPVDTFAAVKMLDDEQMKFRSVTKDDADSDSGSKDRDCPSEYWSPKGSNSDSSPSPQPEESEETTACNGFSTESKDDFMPKFNDAPRKWPLSDDTERTKLLEKIQGMFQMFIMHKSLSVSHLKKVIQFTMDEIQNFPSGSLLLNHALDQSHQCICFLGASQLRKVLKFLQDLSQSCGIGRYAEKDNAISEASISGQGSDVLEDVDISFDSSNILLQGHIFSGENGARDSHSSCIEEDVEGVPDTDALISWLFSGSLSGEQLSAWTRTREEKSHQGMGFLQMLEKEFYLLQSMCERKCEQLSYEEALQTVENLCVEELKRREHAPKFASQRYETILRKRQEELIDRENDAMFTGSRFELDMISTILKEAQALNVSQFGYDESLSGVTSHLCELENGEDDQWRVNDYFHQSDTCIEAAIQRQKEPLLVELNKIDARIMKTATGMQQLELKLGPVSVFDYRRAVIPLVKCFLRLHLEDLVDKDATEKSDAAREAFLAELALDAKKSLNKAGDPKHGQDKCKDKKKNKDFRKSKDTKAVGSNDHTIFPVETTTQFESLADANLVDSELLPNGDYLKQEEEFKRKVELEAEERKLEETLEYQRQIEDEAKRKHLAVLSRNAAGTPGTLADVSQAICSDLRVDHSGPRDYSELNLHNNNTEDCLKGITFGDFPEAAMHKNNQNGVLDQPKHKFTRQTLVQNLELKPFVVESNEKLYEGYTDEVQRLGRNGRTTNNLGTSKMNGVKKTGGPAKSSTMFSLQKDKDTITHSHSKDSQGENGAQTLRELHVDDDDEERFQEDLQKAVRQSLDTFEARKTSVVAPASRLYQDVDISDASVLEPSSFSNGEEIHGTGLKNAVGEYNCFLNVIVQSLWHLRRFRDEFLMKSSLHVHIGNPCVICALYDIFTALSKASKEGHGEAVSSTCLRIALSNLYPDSSFFQEAQMNDASEVLAVLFDCLHQSFTSSGGCDTESDGSNSTGPWDCSSTTCIAHTFFGMNIYEQMNCYNCGVESRHMKYTSFFHNTNANALRTMKMTCAESSFDELLKTVEMNHQLACDLEVGGCGKPNYIYHILSSPPQVFTTVLGWQNMNESVEDISATLAAISMEVDIGVLYQGLDKSGKHSLVSLVCYYGQHYHCFAYENARWVMYDDQTVKVIGVWEDVLSMCERGHLQPQVLFFEAVN